jgi:hypothetical protein
MTTSKRRNSGHVGFAAFFACLSIAASRISLLTIVDSVDDVLTSLQRPKEHWAENPYLNGNFAQPKEGPRPTVHALLQALDSARCAGLFMCGPVSLMNDMRSAAVERCSLRRCQCIAGEPNIALYDEQFAM